MKNICRLCNRPIHRDDFFMDYGQGKMCSTCLVGLETPSMNISSLFAENSSCRLPRQEPNEQVVAEAVQAIS